MHIIVVGVFVMFDFITSEIILIISLAFAGSFSSELNKLVSDKRNKKNIVLRLIIGALTGAVVSIIMIEHCEWFHIVLSFFTGALGLQIFQFVDSESFFSFIIKHVKNYFKYISEKKDE